MVCISQSVITTTQGKIREIDSLLEELAHVEKVGFSEPLQFAAPHMRTGKPESVFRQTASAGQTSDAAPIASSHVPAVKSAVTQPSGKSGAAALPPLGGAAATAPDDSIQL